jgi:chaperonin cofactor prefoldin
MIKAENVMQENEMALDEIEKLDMGWLGLILLALKQKEQGETLPQTKTMIGRQIQALDRQIDGVVYELYGLSDEEIKVVEGKG